MRPAVTYYNAKGSPTNDTQLEAEADDGTSRWNAKLALTEAAAAESKEANRSTINADMGSIVRTQAGVVAWCEGDIRKWDYMVKQR